MGAWRNGGREGWGDADGVGSGARGADHSVCTAVHSTWMADVAGMRPFNLSTGFGAQTKIRHGPTAWNAAF